MYLPNRDELSFLVVFAFPKASRTGFVAKICLSTSLDSSSETFVLALPLVSGGLTEAKYLMMYLACIIMVQCQKHPISIDVKRRRTDSVLPAPL